MIRKTSKRAFEIVLMLLGLTGLVDNLIVWHGFIGSIIDEYATVRSYIFGLLPVDVHPILQDYLIIGSAVVSSLISMLSKRSEESLSHLDSKGWFYIFVEFIVALTFYLFAWPWLLFIMANGYLRHLSARRFYKKTKIYTYVGNPTTTEGSVLFFKQLLTVVIVFLGLLFVASDALSKLMGG